MTSLDRSVAAASGEDLALCRAAGIILDNRPAAEWHTAVLELCKEYRAIPDLDAEAHVHLSQVEQGMLISVWLRDGRNAQRRVHSPEALRPALEALVVVPPARGVPELVTAPYRIAASTVRSGLSARSGNASEQRDDVRIEITGGVVGRVSGTPRYLNAGVTVGAAARWGRWVSGMTLRVEPWTRVSAGYLPGFEMSTVGLGFMLGREVVGSRSLLLDTAVTTTLLSEAQSVQLSEREVSGSEGDVRVGALARCLLGSGPLRPTFTLAAEISPARAGRSIRAADALAPLPSWSVGLGLGLSWLEP
jgi:hypothetical protein